MTYKDHFLELLKKVLKGTKIDDDAWNGLETSHIVVRSRF